MPPVSFQGVGRNRQRWIPMQEIRKTTRTLWFLDFRLMDQAKTGGKNRWMEALAEAEEGSREWVRQPEGSLRWIHMDLEEMLAVTADQAVPKTLSLGLEVWVRAVEVEVGTRADGMEGTEAGMEVLEGTTIVIAITMEEVTKGVEEAEATVNVGQVAGVVEAVVGDTKPSLSHSFRTQSCSCFHVWCTQYHILTKQIQRDHG